MAASLSLSNFLSFLLPSNPPPKTSPQLSFSSPPTQLLSRKSNDKLIPLVGQQSHSGSLSADLSSVICPSLAYANTLFFKSAYNVQVIVDENEPEERLLNRFRREVLRAGVIQECKRRRFFENKQDEKKRKSREAAKRNKKRFFC
ncbi:30S ribosomal protein S21, chloroplastic isoform X2 [Hevea brasiliensis]|uniref:30S ribosomal protein S21, chloroplastic isoform X2 n=1 Tax=Hevea brasiliensis TaxID=3981 RepID=UPI0025DA3F0A|nr:30S ribosomal protein S21, chloroplastic isoform X2 [Hevea brasiliensis]